MARKRLEAGQKLVLRDGAVFAVKLWLDGIKDMVLGFLALAAVVIDLISGRQKDGYRFYKVMKLGNRLDRLIDPYSLPRHEELEATKEPFDDLRG